jgi:predicted helicase
MKFIKGETLDEDNRKVRFPIKSGIIFVNRVEESKRIARDFVEVYKGYFKEEPKIRIEHIDGNMTAEEKRLKIESLRKASISKPVILTNARVLTEGIDVPSLDFVAFFRPKKSEVDIVQALGRVVRRSRCKEYGLIFIPLVIDTEKGNIDEQIDRTNYKTIWQVINAVIAYDETYRVKIRKALLSKKKVSEGLDRVIRDNQPDFDEEVFQILRSPSSPIDLFDGIRKNLTTKVIKTFRIGDKAFLSDWAEETAKLAQILRDQILIAYEKDGDFREKLENLKSSLSKILNESISTNDCVSLIVQYLLTKPILDAIFTQKSEIDLILDEMFEYFKKFLESNIKDLERFYDKVRTRAGGILDEEDRQELLRFIYTRLFSKAFKDINDEMGIAYTPVPLVSFIVNFVDFLTKKHFGKGLGDEGVVILDPFAGVGTFISILIDHIAKEDKGKVEGKLKRKEIWANEILLLPYLIILRNVESVLLKNLGEYTPFTTALWTDSFNLMEKLYEYERKPKDLIGFPKKFKEMVEAQLNAKVNVIISNPPWRAGRENENVGRKNVVYPNLRRRIGETYAKYAKELGATLVNSLYDTYVQALRMATDRIEEGVIGLVLNNGWLYGLSGRGIRKALSEEFAEVYVYDLKGDARKRGEDAKRQGENVFQIRTGNCLLFLVKKKNKTEPAKIYYKAVKDYAKKEEKFAELEEWKEKPDQIPWEEIVPNKYHDWLEQGEEEFENFLKLGDKRNEKEITVFGNYSQGLNTARDSYAYNFSPEELKKNMGRLIETFNEHLERVWKGEITEDNVEEKIEKDERKIKWDSALKNWLFKINNLQEFRDDRVFPAFYRPFIPMYVYFDRVFNARVSQLPSIFPTPSHQNLAIAVSNKGSSRFDVFITDRIADLHFMYDTQLFPLYVYEEQQMMGEKRLVRLYNITDEALNKFRDELKDRRIEKEHIFYYVFGVLSTPEYVKRYENNLKKDLPRVPILQSFWNIAYLGEELAKLQLNYQNLPEYEDENLKVEGDWDPEEFVVDAKLDEKNKVMVINKKVKVYGIPDFAFEYRVGGYPPIRWICDYMKRNEDKESGIVWDPKIKVGEFISLTRKLITLSKRTLEIKRRLSEVIMLP